MLRKILLPTIIVILSWGFWISPDFKTISAGVAIFLFGMLSLEQGFQVFAGSKRVDTAETLFIRHGRNLTEAEREIMLTDDELHALEG